MQAKADARRKMVRGLRDGALEEPYGVRVRCGQFLAEAMVEDEEADLLDAVLAAVQAAWAWTRRDDASAPWGIPADADPAEGWIVDPVTLRRALRPPLIARRARPSSSHRPPTQVASIAPSPAP